MANDGTDKTTLDPELRKLRPETRGRGSKLSVAESSIRREAMVNWTVGEREREPTVKYSVLLKRMRVKFNGTSVAQCEIVMTHAAAKLREDFQKFAADAPRAIFDAYMDIHSEAMREKNWGQARRALDSVRDMFGMKSAMIIHTNSTAAPSAAYEKLTDDQLDALAALDVLPTSYIDARSVEAAVAVVEAENAVVMTAMENSGESIVDDDDDEDSDDGEPEPDL